jgi:RimJ/RimL family protein N-acetyltransferase
MSEASQRVHLRPTMLSDLDFVISVETDAQNLPFITPWDRTQHEGAVRFPDFRHFIVELGAGTDCVGFVILQGCRNPHGSVELKRIVLQPKGQGLGRTCVRLLKRMAFRDLGAHRFWLDVKQLNQRALALYTSEGFVEEGRLRESVRVWRAEQPAGGPAQLAGYDSLVVMSMLDREYQARLALGQEQA